MDQNFEGPDHRCSLNPLELKSMVSSIRNVEESISGNGIKEPSESEKVNIDIVRKSLHLKAGLNKGEILKEEHIICLRPGNGISPMNIDDVLGLRAKKNLEPLTKLSRKDLF